VVAASFTLALPFGLLGWAGLTALLYGWLLRRTRTA
jgi:hypothetical protein